MTEEKAEHDGCPENGELTIPLNEAGELFAKDAQPGYFMVTCEACHFVGRSRDEQLLAMARRVRRRFVVEAVR